MPSNPTVMTSAEPSNAEFPTPSLPSGADAGSSELAILQAVVAAAGAFLHSAEVTSGLPDLLARIGTATNASRVYVFENDPHEPGRPTAATQRAEWTAPGVAANIGTPAVTGVSLDDDGFEWFDAFAHGAPFVAVVDDLPPAPRARLHAVGVLSIAAAPVFVDDEFWGFIGVDNCVTARVWSTVEVNALAAAAIVVGAAIRRKRVEEALRAATIQAQLAADIGEVVTRAGDTLQEMLDRCSAAIVHRLQPDLIRIWMMSESLDCLLACTAAGARSIQQLDSSDLTLVSDALLEIAASRAPTHWRDGVPALWPGSDAELAETGITSGVGFPLITKGRVAGVMVLLGRDFPSATMIDAAASITDEIALAIEQHHAQGAMTRAETRYRRLVEATVEGIVIHDGTHVIDSNPSFAAMTGYTYEEIIGRHPLSFIPTEYHPFVLEQLKLNRTEPYEAEGVTKDGRRFPVELKGSDYTDQGRTLRVATIRDITDRKAVQRTNEKLLEEQQARAVAERTRAQAQFLAEASRVLASSLDTTTTLTQLAHLAIPTLADYCIVSTIQDQVARRVAIVHSDPEMEPILRAAVAAWPEVFPDDHPMYSALREGRTFLAQEMNDEVITSITVTDQHREYLRRLAPRSLMAVPISNGGVVLGSIIFSSTGPDRRYGAEDLALAEEFAQRAALALHTAQSYHEAQAASRARDEMLAVVAHDLRNPLNTIFMGSELVIDLLQQNAAPGAQDDMQVRQLQIIRRSAEHMNRLIQDLLDASRIDSGTLSLEKSAMDTSDLLREAAEMLEPLATHEKIAFEVSCGPGLPLLDADKARLLQVLSNLVGNALKFTPKGGRITVSAVIESEAESRVVFTRFSVEDTGAGIPAEQLPHIFARGWQARRGDRRGIGVGLAIASGIVEAHGGRIWVNSTPGKGSTFLFTIPSTEPAPST